MSTYNGHFTLSGSSLCLCVLGPSEQNFRVALTIMRSLKCQALRLGAEGSQNIAAKKDEGNHRFLCVTQYTHPDPPTVAAGFSSREAVCCGRL